MKANSMRSFAAGLIVSASVCGAVYFAGPNKAASTQKTVEKPTVDEMKTMLTSEGYVIQTNEEWNKQLAAAKKEKNDVKEKSNENKNEKPNEKPNEKIVYRTMLTVTSGMTSIDVGRALEQAHIINSAKDFFNEVEKRGLSNDLRPGTFEVESGKSMDEIIATIFKK
ncbi:hypothetical protein [Cytobacillus dafuensis]|uniref:Endolytic transglycosylase MltG n=1 Tax=Cytobacillus dafuensis TaxID=1742359 RepID=A0A5B8Z4U9_CYTDA|nr:hypothetical protein [Cytobacillus dafuensis]QED48142.1 endolytic transglycosylase MltG [Cytobacillus dafuensis]